MAEKVPASLTVICVTEDCEHAGTINVIEPREVPDHPTLVEWPGILCVGCNTEPKIIGAEPRQ